MQDLQRACLSGLRRTKIQGPLHPSRSRRPVDATKAVPNLQPAVYNLGGGIHIAKKTIQISAIAEVLVDKKA